MCGKSTVIGESIDDFIEKNPKLPNHLNKELLDKIKDSLAGLQVMIIFSNQDLAEITKITGQYIIEKQAKPGQISPIEVIIPAGLMEWMPLKLSISRHLKSPQRL